MVELTEVNSISEEIKIMDMEPIDNSDEEYITDDDQLSEVLDNDDEEEEFTESIIERISALQDAIPFELKQSVRKTFNKSYSVGKSAASWLGSGMWIIATGASVLLLPLAMEIEKEHAAVQQEAQVALQQQQAAQIVAE